MNTKALSVTDVARHFSDYVNRVAYRNERFVLRKGRMIMAELRPVVAGKRLGELSAIMASLPRMSESDLSSFSKDMCRSRKNIAGERMRNPWES
ncbi:MAG: hypothetical protein V1897_06700 [Pseudomonadota bacterium]